jgi:beta-glucanase (GH16 family)
MVSLQNGESLQGSRAMILALALTVAVPAGAVNLLNNPGFEGCSPGPAVNPIDAWNWLGKTWNTVSVTDATLAHGGAIFLKLFGASSSTVNYSAAYQRLPCTAGAEFQATAWAYSASADGGGLHGQDQLYLEVSFRDATDRTLALFRSDVVAGNNIASHGGLDRWFPLTATTQYAFFVVNGEPVATTPTNTVTRLTAPDRSVFVLYQLTFRQGPDNASGSAYFDDCLLDQLSGTPQTWNIVWSDEFNGTVIDRGKWRFERGNGTDGWGNKELEYYTDWSQNAYVSNGLLNIVALQTNYGGFHYTSARMKTQGAFQKTYGRVEFRGRLPVGFAYWPAFWLLGSNFPQYGWPACGEIDVMENRGSNLHQVQATAHYDELVGGKPTYRQATAFYNFDDLNAVTNFHSYALEWTTNVLRWYVDGFAYLTRTNWTSTIGPYPSPFDKPFFLLVNLAVGGNYVFNPTVAQIDASNPFPGVMQVDYVRVCDITPPLQLTVTNTGSMALSWPPGIICRLQRLTNGFPTATWSDVPAAHNPYVVPVPVGAGTVFYRLQSP